MPEPWQCRLWGWSKTEVIWGWNGWKQDGGGGLKGNNPANMARAQVQSLNWLNSLWNGIPKKTFHLLDSAVPELRGGASPYPFSLFQRFLFKASWRVSVDDESYQYLWPSSVKLLCSATQVSQIFFLFILLLLLTHASFSVLCSFFCNYLHVHLKIEHLCTWYSCDVLSRRWWEVMEGLKWFSVAGCFLSERPWCVA